MTDDIKAIRDALQAVNFYKKGGFSYYPDEFHKAANPERIARLLDALERRTEALRYFIGAQHPVSTEIDDRGHRWVEAYLDEALPHAIAAMKGQT